jgi:2'-5' RNA ligase
MVSKFLIGIHPPRNVVNRVKSIKSKVLKKLGFQNQANIEPHITFNLNDFESIDSIDAVMKEICLRFKPIRVRVEGLTTFPRSNDEDVVVYSVIEPKSELRRLQKALTKELSSFRIGENLRSYLENNPSITQLDDRQVKTSKKYGYPFIGRFWIPHMSIAFIDASKFDQIKEEIMKERIDEEFLLKELTVFIYNNESHNWEPLRTYSLKKEK